MSKKVILFGVFDGMHKGHEFLLGEAMKHGNINVVVATDNNVEKLKGRKPKHNEEERLKIISDYLSKFGKENKAILGDENDFMKPLLEIKPDVICLGYDQKDYIDIIKDYMKINPNAKIVRIKPYKPEIYKSSLINSIITNDIRILRNLNK